MNITNHTYTSKDALLEAIGINNQAVLVWSHNNKMWSETVRVGAVGDVYMYHGDKDEWIYGDTLLFVEGTQLTIIK